MHLKCAAAETSGSYSVSAYGFVCLSWVSQVAQAALVCGITGEGICGRFHSNSVQMAVNSHVFLQISS